MNRNLIAILAGLALWVVSFGMALVSSWGDAHPTFWWSTPVSLFGFVFAFMAFIAGLILVIAPFVANGDE